MKIIFRIKVRRNSSLYQFFQGEAKLVRAICGTPVSGTDLGNDVWKLETSKDIKSQFVKSWAEFMKGVLKNDLGDVMSEKIIE